jgi:hypothetical protein
MRTLTVTNEAPLNDGSTSANGADTRPDEAEARLRQLRDYAARTTTESDRHLAERDLLDQRVKALQSGLEALHALAQSTDDAAILKQAIAELRDASRTPPH